jgi:hypothetical protein
VTVSDFLDGKQKEINKRLAELKPLAEEYQQLEAAAAALRKIPGASRAASSAATPAASPVKATRKKRGRPKGSGKKAGRPPGSTAKAAASPAKRRAGRRKGSGQRANQALSLVQGQPGITIPELAASMGIKQNYLYRVLPGLEQDGKVAKKGRGWHPKAA